MGPLSAPIRMLSLLSAAALLTASAPAAEGDRYPRETLLLFVASWCAPCHAELGQIGAITRAAGPYRVLVVPFDDTRSSMAMLGRVPPTQRWVPDPTMRKRIASELFVETAGLPFSVAIGADGRPCGSVRLGLDAARAGALVVACRR